PRLQRLDSFHRILRTQSARGDETHRSLLQSCKSSFRVEALPSASRSGIKQKQIERARKCAQSIFKPGTDRNRFDHANLVLARLGIVPAAAKLLHILLVLGAMQ